ncbi:chemotaxis protein CheA [Tepidiforma flava]|uniref:Chemotaxis protein CheA n=1 Tax=Tepidiforma flava TaxID=3004094 RepID=A0ABY7M519_9CHLR|nr:chemotaxis protein CheA [Tepidiforma flava]WBL35631.1 chemotaxis protein CheA [Tepidiforma flava]
MASTKGTPLQFDLDDEDLKLFLEEAEEQIELLDQSLVQLEGEPDPALVQRIFRAAHTLKGSSATIGHKKMASLTHAMETVLDAVRQGRRAPTSDVVDALLAGLDALRVLANEVVTRVDSGIETERLEADLMAVLEGDGPAVALPEAHDAPVYQVPAGALECCWEDVEQGQGIYFVDVTIASDCQLPSIRCYQVLQEMESIGKVAACWPERDVIEAGGGEYRMASLLVTRQTDEQVAAALKAVSDVAAVRLRQVPPAEATGPIEGFRDEPQQPAAARPEAGEAREDAPAETQRGANGRKASQSVRIDVERLDGLMNLVGELVIDRTRLQQVREQLSSVLRDASLSELMDNFEETTSHLARVTDELQEQIMRSRMLPVRSVLSRLPRLVRDVAVKCGKKVDLVTAGEETELDRSVIEEISDPLVHILRNAVDHGIESPEERRAAGKPETGTISVTAWNQETYIYLAVRDDGRGIDTSALRRKVVEKGLMTREAAEASTDDQVVQWIFMPGLSTAKQITDVSGRGVGMDIVRTNIERLNGQITVSSVPGKGTEVIIQLPLTLATTKALMVSANGTVYAIPLVSVTEALADHEADIHTVGGRKTLRLRHRLLPMIDLAAALGDTRPRMLPTDGYFVVAARHGDRQAAFIVDRLLGEQDVVVKSLGDMLGTRKGLTGATILGDGTLGLIVDIASLVTEQAAVAVPA